MTDPDVVRVTVHIAAQPETVFPYFTDPARYVRWMGREATLEAVPGGSYRVRMRDGVEVSGHFVEVDPPQRLVFTWGWIDDERVAAGSTRVTVTLEAAQGGTRVTLLHHDLPSERAREQHSDGWRMYLDRLEVSVRGGDLSRDPNG